MSSLPNFHAVEIPVPGSASERRGGETPQSRPPENLSSPQVLRVPAWAAEGWLVHGFSTRLGGASRIEGAARADGDLNLGYTALDRPETVSANRESFRDALLPSDARRPEWGMVTLKQMHSALARRVGRAEIAERAALWGDGLMTDEPGVLLGIQTADCLPVLVADRRRRAVAAFHAGWRGTLKGIVERGVSAMGLEFGSEPGDLVAAIGPGIGRCCFAVGAEVRELFAAKYAYAGELLAEDAPQRLDLVEANRRQLLAAGVAAEAIFALDECTSCRTDRFFSYRAERGKTGRLMAVIGIAPS